MHLEIDSTEEMKNLGRAVGKTARPDDLLLLNGDLGAGKTTMTQGIGSSLGIVRPIKSPTYTIVREYREGRFPLFHMDFYRLEKDDLSSIDIDNYLTEPGLVVIEWSEMIKHQLSNEFLQLTISRVDDSWQSTKRIIEFTAQGKRNENWLKEILASF